MMAAAVAMALPPAASAQPLDLSEIIEVRLLEGWRQQDGRHMSALEIRLAPGWKTYWRSPGDGGIPTQLTLDQGDPRIYWPSPEVFYTAGLRSVGYESDVILPLQLSLAEGDQPVSGQVEMGVCEDICIPVNISLDALLPDGGRPDPRIIAALSDRPLSAEEAGVGAVRCDIRPIEDGLQVEARIPMPNPRDGAEVVVELPDPTIWISEPQLSRAGGDLVAVADIVPAFAGAFALNRSELRFTILGDGPAIDVLGCTAG